MIRRALLLTLTALAVRFLLNLISLANAVVHSTKILVQPLEFVLGLFSPVSLIAFLLVLYRELSGHRDTHRRQAFALAAAMGAAISLGLTLWHFHETSVALSSLTPETRAQLPAVPGLTARWVRTAIWSVLPSVIWYAFLLIFWRQALPLGRTLTRKLAAVLCVITVFQGISSVRGLLPHFESYIPDWTGRPIRTSWNLIISPGMLLFVSFAVPYFLFWVWWTPPEHDTTEAPAPLLLER